jgi:hypothetical protein
VTVAELIEKLSALPPDAKVMVYNPHGEQEEARSVYKAYWVPGEYWTTHKPEDHTSEEVVGIE